MSDDFTAAADPPLIVAIHGGTYTSEYFDVPGYSLLARAAAAGIPVIALDRPNYAGSDPMVSDDSIIRANADALRGAIGTIWEQYGASSPGIVLIGHSIGAAVTIDIAASSPTWPLLGLAISGCLMRLEPEFEATLEALPPIPMIEIPSFVKDHVMFGPAGTFSEDMPAASHTLNALVPRAELMDIMSGWIVRRAQACASVSVPVHHRQAEFDALWLTNQDEIDEFRAGFTSARSVDSAIESDSGHCIDFHVAGERFQSSQLEFARDCATVVMT